MRKPKTYRLVESKTIFIITLIVITLTILGVFLLSLGHHHTFFENSITSTTILSIAFFWFISIGLFKGIKLKDNLGTIINKSKTKNTDPTKTQLIEPPTMDLPDIDFVDVGEGLAGIILSIVLWILVAIILSVGLWVFSNVVFMAVLAFAAMLYWIFFRALRLVFKNSNRCKGNLFESVKCGFTYTFLYNFWIYGIFLIIGYLKG